MDLIEAVKTVGVRELKNRLSEYLRQVRAGEELLVTDRGEVVAELTPPGHRGQDATVPAGLVALARRGVLTLGVSGDEKLYPRLPRRPRRLRAADLTCTECDRVVIRAAVLGDLTEADAADRRAYLTRAAAHWHVLRIGPEIVDRVRQPFPNEPIRTLDALREGFALMKATAGRTHR